jgi:hypothetical protein
MVACSDGGKGKVDGDSATVTKSGAHRRLRHALRPRSRRWHALSLGTR